MKILYIAPENAVGQLELWQRIHRSRGHECRFVTYFHSSSEYAEDICLNLPWIPHKPRAIRLRHKLYTKIKGPAGDWHEVPGNPPIWQPRTILERTFFTGRDQLWRLWVEPAVKRFGLLDFDLYHLESGVGFYRNGDFVTRVAEQHKPILNIYHGNDFRNRGIIPAVDRHIWLNLTSEYDLLPRHPKLEYLYLPFDVEAYEPKKELHDPITLCHATRHRYVKGSDHIIQACLSLVQSHGIRFILIENQPHAKAMELKVQADIYIDQVMDIAPGYGMNSIEAMALGLACVNRMNAAYEAFMPGHPFINVTPETLLAKLTELVEHPEHIRDRGHEGRRYAEEHHSLKVVGEQLYGYYRQLGIIGDGN
jgi:glycosyltransferase involved in cell wall biosynthesis